MRKFLTFCLCLLTSLNAAVKQNTKVSKAKTTVVITTEKDRQTLISGYEQFLLRSKINFSAKSPFVFVEKKDSVEEEPREQEPIEIVQEVELPTMNELVLLKGIGEAIRPEGSAVVENGHWQLFINGSRILKEGDRLEATYNEKIYIVTVKEITQKTFTLELNNYLLSFNY